MILPLWPTQVWQPQHLRMIIVIPFVLPKHQDLLSLSHSPHKLNPLRKKLTVLCFKKRKRSSNEKISWQQQLADELYKAIKRVQSTTCYCYYSTAYSKKADNHNIYKLKKVRSSITNISKIIEQKECQNVLN